jgi:NADH-quinone oxidoreductase subunit M
MFNHGLSAAALFACVGIIEARSGGTRGRHDFGGVRTAAPLFAGLLRRRALLLARPARLNGFVGEFLIFRGVFGLRPPPPPSPASACSATALFLLTFWQRVSTARRRGASAFADCDRG